MEVQDMTELPGEANPLTEGILYHVLRSAASSDPQQIQTGTKQLQQWESQRRYYILLQSVFLDRSLPLEVRYLAIIQLKNGIDKYWRKTAHNAIDSEDKVLIRSRLLESGISEADHRLALQNALIIAKVIRIDWPNNWLDAIPEVIRLLRASSDSNANRIHLPRVLLILLQIIKELSTGRLLRLRLNLQQIAPEIFQIVGQIYIERVQRWESFLQGRSDDEGGALEAIEQSLLSMKILRRLVIAGFEFPNRDTDIQKFWDILQGQLGDFLNLLSDNASQLSTMVQRLIEKHLIQFSKLHLEMARIHPAAFVLLPDSLDLVRVYWNLIAKFGEVFGMRISDFPSTIGTDRNTDDDDKPIIERLSLKGLLLIRACVKMVFNPQQAFKLRQPREKEEKTQATELVKLELLTEGFVREVMEIIVARYFVFRTTDLQQWAEEPEEWELREEGSGESWEYSVRPCSEKLFMDLAINFKPLLVQPLLNVFYAVASPDNENILFKDSVYTAMGLAAAVLSQQLDFDAFLRSTLVPEVQKHKPGYNILRRRIAILLGQWISVNVSKQSRPLVYELYQFLLNKDDELNDRVVRITAGKQFRNAADEWEFRAEQFLPFAPKVLVRLMALVEEVELTETKMALLNTISVIVERLEHHITPYAQSIVNLLPPLWEQSGEEHLMKQAILTILTRLINSMKAESRPYHALVLPIIKCAIEPGSESQVYLLEDALELWSAVLIQTKAPASPDLTSLTQSLLIVLTLGSDTLHKALEITESYLLLAPSDLLVDHVRMQLLDIFAGLIGTLPPDLNGKVCLITETIIRAVDGIGGEQAVTVLLGEMMEKGFFHKVLEGLYGAWQAHQSLRRNVPSFAVDGVVETDYFSILARLGMASIPMLVSAIEAEATNNPVWVASRAPENCSPSDKMMKWLLEEWFSHIENIGDPPRKKLMNLVLTKFLESNQPWILLKLQDLMIAWTDIVIELTEGYDDKTVDSLLWEFPSKEELPIDPESPEDTRRRELIYTDYVHTINVITYIQQHLSGAVVAAGGEEHFKEEWLANVDKEVVEAFGRLGIIGAGTIN